MMVAYHFVFDLPYFFSGTPDPYSGIWILIARVVQYGFLSAVGLSLYLSFKKAPDYSIWLKRMEVRAFKLFGVAMAITLVTWLVAPDAYIRFGILHLISVSILLGALIIPSTALTGAAFFLSLALGIYLSGSEAPYSFLIPFGLPPANFYTFDYFPLFPWFSVVLAGILLAKVFEHLSWLQNPKWLGRFPALEKIGQHSLLIYLIHQPILLGGLWILFHL